MKKVLCALLAMGMLCGTAALTSCKGGCGGNSKPSGTSSSRPANGDYDGVTTDDGGNNSAWWEQD